MFLNETILNILFLLPLISIGLICAYTDIKKSKIFNRWVAVGLLYAFFLYLLLIAYSLLIEHQEGVSFVFRMIQNGAIAFLLGYILWRHKLWSAGDAKLFTVYAFLIPPTFYQGGYLPHFPSFNLLVNLFVPLLLFFTGLMLFSYSKNIFNRKKWHYLNKDSLTKETRGFFSIFIKTFSVVISIKYLFLITEKSILLNNIITSPFVLFILIYLSIKAVNILKGKTRLPIVSAPITIIVFYFLITSAWSEIAQTLFMVTIFSIFIGLLRKSLANYIGQKETKPIEIDQLQAGMMISRNQIPAILKTIKEDERARLGALHAGIFKSHQIDYIKKLHSRGGSLEKLKQVKICKTLPFAPLLLLSAIITLITRSSFLPIIASLFRFLFN
jgi:Flp pilus assembly protein protease CpaA